MTDSEKLDFLIEEIAQQSEAINDLKAEIRETKYDLKQELRDAKSGSRNPKSGLGDSVRELKFLLQEEICKPLSMVAEGQPELSRKMDQFLKMQKEQQKELELTIGALEIQVQELMEKRRAL